MARMWQNYYYRNLDIYTDNETLDFLTVYEYFYIGSNYC